MSVLQSGLRKRRRRLHNEPQAYAYSSRDVHPRSGDGGRHAELRGVPGHGGPGVARMPLLRRHETLDPEHTEPHEGQGTLSLELGQRTGTARLLGEPATDRRGRRRRAGGAGTPDSPVGDGDPLRLWQGDRLKTCCSRD